MRLSQHVKWSFHAGCLYGLWVTVNDTYLGVSNFGVHTCIIDSTFFKTNYKQKSSFLWTES